MSDANAAGLDLVQLDQLAIKTVRFLFVDAIQKTNSLCRTDCICKYNQLLRIEEQHGAPALFAGTPFERDTG